MQNEYNVGIHKTEKLLTQENLSYILHLFMLKNIQVILMIMTLKLQFYRELKTVAIAVTTANEITLQKIITTCKWIVYVCFNHLKVL